LSVDLGHGATSLLESFEDVSSLLTTEDLSLSCLVLERSMNRTEDVPSGCEDFLWLLGTQSSCRTVCENVPQNFLGLEKRT
jgi:hypothetical protein